MSTSSIITKLDGHDWLLATDPENKGQTEKWYNNISENAVSTCVPWIIQEQFPGYEGAAWYWKTFDVPSARHRDGRYLLKFWEIDFKATVYLNGEYIGEHVCRESAFTLDITDMIRHEQPNLLAVRIVSPSTEPVDGIVYSDTPTRWRQLTKRPEDIRAANGLVYGGIIDSVELIDAPAMRISDLFVRADPHTGLFNAELTICNYTQEPQSVHIDWAVSDREGRGVCSVKERLTVGPGENAVTAALQLENPSLWTPEEPYLYFIEAELTAPAYAESVDRAGVRMGFREFSFRDGYFRLNGRRIFIKSAHTLNNYPGGLRFARDREFYRKDLIDLKAMGFNMVRFLDGIPVRTQLELADELGLMVHEESTTAGFHANEGANPHFKEWFETILSGMIRRDRNHTCVVIWGILNEIWGEYTYRYGVKALDLVRSLDDTRMVLFNSGGNYWCGARQGEWIPEDIPVRVRTYPPLWTPCIACNPDSTSRKVLGTEFPPESLIMLPSKLWTESRGTVSRWIALSNGDVDLVATFMIAGNASFSVHIMKNGETLFTDELYGMGDTAQYQNRIQVVEGDHIDLIAALAETGPFGGGIDCTVDPGGVAVQASIVSDRYASDDCVVCFDQDDNANKTGWSWGTVLIKNRVPDVDTFAELTRLDHTEYRLQYEEAHTRGCISNPHSYTWDAMDVADIHRYLEGPHQPGEISFLRTVGDPGLARGEYNSGKSIYLSEYGVGSGVDLARVVRLYRQSGFCGAPDQVHYELRYKKFMADFQQWHMEKTFGRPEEFFQQSLRHMASLRAMGLQTLRSNPRIVGHNITGANDQVLAGEGLTTTFRELKPGAFDAVRDAWAKLLWCTFVEPVNVYSGEEVLLEAVLSNEDVLKPGEYPARAWLFDECNRIVFSERFTVTIRGDEEPFAIPTFQKRVAVSGTPGTYRFVVDFERDAAATGGEMVFNVFDHNQMPEVKEKIVIWGYDASMERWLNASSIECEFFSKTLPVDIPRVILVLHESLQPIPAAMDDLVERIEQGSRVLFLSPNIFGNEQGAASLIPVKRKGFIDEITNKVYHPDYWNKNHPIFNGMPSGSLMDWIYYRELLHKVQSFRDIETPDEVLAAANDVSTNYQSGILIGQYRLGQGEFILNALRIGDYLGIVPQAELLLRNVLNFLCSSLNNS